VVVIERSEYKSRKVGEILPPIIKNLLVNLGVWDRFLSEKPLPSLGIRSAWGQPDLYENNFFFNPYGNGWHVDRQRFDAMLAKAIEEADVILHCGARLVSCVPVDGTGWDLEIVCQDKRFKYRSKFLVDATGRASAVAVKQGAKRISYDQLIGVVGFLSPTSEIFTDYYMLLEAVEDGWWYSAVLPDFRLVVAYMTDADLYAKGVKSSVTYWQDQLRKASHTQSRTASYVRKSSLIVVSANSCRTDQITGRNWLAVGDAAIAFDPLSSIGVYKALESGLQVARSIEDYLAGKEKALQDYSSWVNKSFQEYLILRQKYYSKEGRWQNSKFWQRRQRKH
jgi:flavin-dependent dehydrogenase